MLDSNQQSVTASSRTCGALRSHLTTRLGIALFFSCALVAPRLCAEPPMRTTLCELEHPTEFDAVRPSKTPINKVLCLQAIPRSAHLHCPRHAQHAPTGARFHPWLCASGGSACPIHLATSQPKPMKLLGLKSEPRSLTPFFRFSVFPEALEIDFRRRALQHA